MHVVSVILATYNGADAIERTVKSILGQTGINVQFKVELIIVDDCSTDNTVALLEPFDLQIYRTPKNSGGPNTGRNIGLKHATGDFICIADQDDEWEPHKLATLLPFTDRVKIVTSGYTVIDSTTHRNMVRVNNSGEPHLYFERNATFLTKLTKSHTGQNTYLGSILYSKEFQHILFEEHFGMVDFDWVVRLFHGQDSIEVSQSLYNRYVEGSNLSLNEGYRRKDYYYSLMFIEDYEDTYPKAVETARKRINGSRARYYYLMDNMHKARFYFLKSSFGMKTLMYYLTTYVGSSFVKKRFNVFG
ncbi:glycosyltransferase family 2 protein [Pontibacter sp. G13]|uniref:glycosyltransferase family 2 protein n=1 Tax=Pontibacter sp. G13 TaxID=3074898 RepID=UPI00288B2CC2|nr:glycosyltransferase family 2 protein [Pontibacter sp. G13]WNJ17606.1 glycosyltransferase family 2 protein [Pontibacter sp. G13]